MLPDGATSTRPVRVIALMNQKGGVGKTTTTVNLAAAFARAGRSTLVIDLDPQSHATLHLGVDPAAVERSAYDLFTDASFDPNAAVREVSKDLWLLPATTDLAGVETELATTAAPQRQHCLERALAALKGRFEFVLIDCPPSLGLLTVNALAAAREVIIPMQAHFLALQGVGKLLETVQLVSRGVNPRLRVTGVVLCMHDPSSTHTREVVSDLEAFFDAGREQESPWRFARVLRPAVRRNIKLAECPSFGKTIFDYAPDAPGAQDYAAIAEPLLKEWNLLLARLGAAAGEQKGEAPVPVTIVAKPTPTPTPTATTTREPAAGTGA
ncbi:Sporulation initiation inhibitor protein Soj [Phycisphaerales bacterium]|nr:Sporulation initiation inhibitor protein Soj [Phycisphaerales bacterium]